MKNWKKEIACTIVAAVVLGCGGWNHMVDGVLAEKESGVSQEETRRTGNGLTVAEQVQAPERFCVESEYFAHSGDENRQTGQKIHIVADAPVEIPDVEEIHLKKVAHMAFTEETMQQFLNSITDEGAPKLQELYGIYSTYGTEMNRQGISYSFDGKAGILDAEEDEYTESYMNLQIADNFHREGQTLVSERTGEVLSEQLTLTDEEYKQEAKKILDEFGYADFYPETIVPIMGNRETGVRIFCERAVDGVRVSDVDDLFFLFIQDMGEGLDYWSEEHIEVDYCGSILTRFMHGRPLTVSDYSDEALFLLPFDEIEGIFTDLLGLRMTFTEADLDGPVEMYENILDDSDEFPYAWPVQNAFLFDEAEVNIHKVRLGYMRLHDQEQSEAEPGTCILVPVWDFYGTWTAIKTGEDGEIIEKSMSDIRVPLLTLDARDGSVLTRKMGL